MEYWMEEYRLQHPFENISWDKLVDFVSAANERIQSLQVDGEEVLLTEENVDLKILQADNEQLQNDVEKLTARVQILEEKLIGMSEFVKRVIKV